MPPSTHNPGGRGESKALQGFSSRGSSPKEPCATEEKENQKFGLLILRTRAQVMKIPFWDGYDVAYASTGLCIL